jgi:hypothetical protein
MIEFVTKQEIFSVKKEQLFERLRKNIFFPENVFLNTFEYIIAFDFDWHVKELFYNGLIKFLKNIDQKDFTLYILNPSPNVYYHKHFGIYGMSIISIDNNYREYLNFLNKPLSNEKEYAREDFEVASNDIAYFSDSSAWCIYGARNWEIAIVAFQNERIGNLFLDSYGEDKDMFLSLSDRIEDLDNMFHFSVDVAKEYSLLLSHYSAFKTIL